MEIYLMYFSIIIGIACIVALIIYKAIHKQSILKELKISVVLIDLALTSKDFTEFKEKLINLAKNGFFEESLKELEALLRAWSNSVFSILLDKDGIENLIKLIKELSKKE